MRTIRRIAEEEVVLVALLSTFAVIFVLVFPPTLLVADSWLTLSAGRELVEHGLPHHEHLTVLALGRTWTDQQWGAQLLFYGAHALGGLPDRTPLNARVTGVVERDTGNFYRLTPLASARFGEALRGVEPR